VVKKMFPAGLVPRVQGAIGDLWYASGGAGGPVGLPVTDELPATGGAWNGFERGRIYWSPGTGAHWVRGSVLQAWLAARAENGFLGYPTSNEKSAKGGGAWHAFQGGRVYWSPGTGAHWVRGGILGLWTAQGAEGGALGYPTTDELQATGGAWHAFQKGRVYWSPKTGAHFLTGAVLQAWLKQGAENGKLGYPTSDPHAVSGGTRVDFQRGSLTANSAGKVVSSTAPTTTAPKPTTTAPKPTTSAPKPTTPTKATTTAPKPSTSTKVTTKTTTPSSTAPTSTPTTTAPSTVAGTP
jgi:uncharacterized protein with LGFP repeats